MKNIENIKNIENMEHIENKENTENRKYRKLFKLRTLVFLISRSKPDLSLMLACRLIFSLFDIQHNTLGG